MKFDVRVMADVTLDFIIEAEDAYDAKKKAKSYTKYVEGGKVLHNTAYQQNIRMSLDGDDELTNCFFMESNVEDVNEMD